MKDKGLSLIEALVCIVIVGIGFIGVNQMISYATSSMDRALESNKINFLSETACLLYTSPSPRDRQKSRMPSSA